MSPTRVIFLTALAMLAFAGNSLLCRAALASGRIDAASFTALRVVAGALTLCLIVRLRHGALHLQGSWVSALALFAYAAAFSFAYLSLGAATGALLLFGAVQATMIGIGAAKKERPDQRQVLGLAVALAGLIGLLLPGLAAPPWQGALLMLAAGSAWGIYSLRGKGAGDPLRVNAGNFLRAGVFAAILGLATLPRAAFDGVGFTYAITSGALTSGIGYAIWYAALPGLRVTAAAAVQLSVPVLSAIGGVVLLGEPLTPRLLLASLAILGGIALVLVPPKPSAAS